MKKNVLIILIIMNYIMYIPISAQNKKLKLSNITIAIDPGHGGKDIGTSFQKIYEKDINLSISLLLKTKLETFGAKIIMTREGDYDLSYPKASRRKKSDFDNRIEIINNNSVNLFLSIHQNYYHNAKYKGAQIFYKNNKDLASIIQKKLNPNRKIKPIQKSLYMYNKLESAGLLIECGFLSNTVDRSNLINISYQKSTANIIAESILQYFEKE